MVSVVNHIHTAVRYSFIFSVCRHLRHLWSHPVRGLAQEMGWSWKAVMLRLYGVPDNGFHDSGHPCHDSAHHGDGDRRDDGDDRGDGDGNILDHYRIKDHYNILDHYNNAHP